MFETDPWGPWKWFAGCLAHRTAHGPTTRASSPQAAAETLRQRPVSLLGSQAPQSGGRPTPPHAGPCARAGLWMERVTQARQSLTCPWLQDWVTRVTQARQRDIGTEHRGSEPLRPRDQKAVCRMNNAHPRPPSGANGPFCHLGVNSNARRTQE